MASGSPSHAGRRSRGSQACGRACRGRAGFSPPASPTIPTTGPAPLVQRRESLPRNLHPHRPPGGQHPLPGLGQPVFVRRPRPGVRSMSPCATSRFAKVPKAWSPWNVATASSCPDAPGFRAIARTRPTAPAWSPAGPAGSPARGAAGTAPASRRGRGSPSQRARPDATAIQACVYIHA